MRYSAEKTLSAAARRFSQLKTPDQPCESVWVLVDRCGPESVIEELATDRTVRAVDEGKDQVEMEVVPCTLIH